MRELRRYVLQRLNINDTADVRESATLNDLLSLSPTAINSIDILEAFAGAIADLGPANEMDLPAFTLDARFNDVLTEIHSQLENKEATQ